MDAYYYARDQGSGPEISKARGQAEAGMQRATGRRPPGTPLDER
jgi:hypothetical protein